MTIYHGTPEIVSPPWSLDHLGKSTGHRADGPGINWTPDPDLAGHFGVNVYATEIDINELVRRSDHISHRGFSYLDDCMQIAEKAPRWEMVLSDWDENRAVAYRALKKVFREQDDPVELLLTVWCEAYPDDTETVAFLETAVDHGHRGILVKENHPDGDSPVAVIFDPTLLNEARLLSPEEFEMAVKLYNNAKKV